MILLLSFTMHCRKMVSGLGPRIISAAHFNNSRQAMLLGSTEIAVLEHREEDLQEQKMASHNVPVTCAMYNPLFQQVSCYLSSGYY